MKHIRILPILLLLAIGLLNCKDDSNSPQPTASSQTELLVANKWALNRVATPDGQSVSQSQLSVTTVVLYELYMEFKADGTVRAINQKTSQIPNGGTWRLAADNKSIDVVVTGFSGNFPFVELSRTRMTLRQSAPVNGKTTDINLEFLPSL